jgi:hypothetical protein
MIAFIDDHGGAYGLEPICKVLPIAPSTYHAHVAKRRDPAKRSARARQDAALKIEVRRVFDQNFSVYGVRRVWRQLKLEGFDVARCTRDMGLQGVIRGKPVKTTISDKAAPCPLDHVNRQFKAPRTNVLWLSDFTFMWKAEGWLYVSAVIDLFSRRVVGWSMSASMTGELVADALLMAVWRRGKPDAQMHHSDRGSQGGFKRSSQHQLLSLITEDHRRSSSASAGVFQPSVFRGRALRAAATADISSALWMLRSVPFGKYCRSNPLVFSLVPRCQGLCGSQK